MFLTPIPSLFLSADSLSLSLMLIPSPSPASCLMLHCRSIMTGGCWLLHCYHAACLALLPRQLTDTSLCLAASVSAAHIAYLAMLAVAASFLTGFSCMLLISHNGLSCVLASFDCDVAAGCGTVYDAAAAKEDCGQLVCAGTSRQATRCAALRSFEICSLTQCLSASVPQCLSALVSQCLILLLVCQE